MSVVLFVTSWLLHVVRRCPFSTVMVLVWVKLGENKRRNPKGKVVIKHSKWNLLNWAGGGGGILFPTLTPPHIFQLFVVVLKGQKP
jgi:hypothetical protein